MAGQWNTPNEPDGIDLQAIEVSLIDGRVVWQVQWHDPIDGERCVMPTGEQDRAKALQWGRYIIWRAYGDRVIPPEHRYGEFDV